MRAWNVAAALLLITACGKGAATAPQTPPPTPVVVGKVTRKAVPVTLRAIGNVVPVTTVAVRSRVTGQVLKVHVPDGAEVARGQALFTIDSEPYRIAVARAEAQLARDQALLAKADEDVARYTKLVDKEYVTREQFDAATSQAAALRATIRADDAGVESARLDLAYCEITAPIGGRAGTIGVDAGNLVKANEDPPLLTIVPTRPVKAAFSVPEKYLTEVRARSAAGKLGVTAAGATGTLTFIDNTVDRTTGTIRLEATFPNDDRALWPGQFVELELTLSEQRDAVVAPTTAIQVGQQGSYVFVVAEDGTAQMRPVTVERTVDDDSIIASGLEGGETVITEGQLRVVPGAKVAPQ